VLLKRETDIAEVVPHLGQLTQSALQAAAQPAARTPA
jgi:hypothetical protein